MGIEADVADWIIKKMEIDKAYTDLKAQEADIIMQIKEQYPADFKDWQRGKSTLRVHGVELKVARSYNIDKLRALLGEEHPELFETETIVKEKVNGRKVAELWKEADMVDKLSETIEPSVPRLSVRK